MKLVTTRVTTAATTVANTVNAGVLRSLIGLFFLGVGAGSMAYVSTAVGQQQKECDAEFGTCVWGRIEPKL